MVISDELQKKYGFLLQPIKDLTKNWEIDVAHVLEDYLEELEKMTFSFDNGQTVLNFAEASLLIQGTACVWGKKVEYLYALVKQTLDMITNRQSASQVNAADAANDKPEEIFDDEDEKLLILDDIAITSERLQSSTDDPVVSIPIVPAGMLENDTDNRGRVIVKTNKNDAVCHTNDFWEACFIPFEKKMSILERDSGGLLDKILVRSADAMGAYNTEPMPDSSQCDEEPDPPDISCDNMDPDPGEFDAMDDGIGNGNNSIAPFAEIIGEPGRGMRLRSAAPDKLVPMPETIQFPITLDPHKQCIEPTWTSKPYQKLKSFRLPESIMVTTRKRKHSPLPLNIPPISMFMKNRGFRRKVAKCESGNLIFFNEAHQKMKNQLLKVIKRQVSGLKFEGLENIGLPGKEIESDSVYGDDNFVEDQNEFADHSDNAAPDLEDLIGDVAQAQGGDYNTQDEGMSDGPSASPTSYEDLVRHHVELFYQAARRHKEETALSQRVKLWDETITPRLVEQDERPEFDIHKYGDIMLDKFERPQVTKRFEEVVDSSNTWYISRLFAATLQLVNDNNFLISKDEDFTRSVNTMTLTLLSHHKLRERLDEYTPQT